MTDDAARQSWSGESVAIAAWVRFFTPSFRYADVRWVFTVLSATCSRLAISPFLMPTATHARISCSRRVRSGCPRLRSRSFVPVTEAIDVDVPIHWAPPWKTSRSWPRRCDPVERRLAVRPVALVPGRQGPAPLRMIEHLPLGEHPVAAESRHFHRGRVARTFGEDERLGPALVLDGSDHEEATPEAMRSSPREAACLRSRGTSTDTAVGRATHRIGGVSGERGSSRPWPMQTRPK